MTYDVFFSYNWQDREAVEAAARALQERNFQVLLDRWYLAPGRPWPQALEDALNSCRAVAVFLGPHGMGRWQHREKGPALDRQARDPRFPVIPVLLDGADPALGFFSLNTWVDFRGQHENSIALDVFAAALQGEAPGPELQERIKATLAAVCPYRGLRPFREEDAPCFLGREAFAEELFQAVARHSVVALVGPSGSGKSSLTRAGLFPQLRREDTGQVWEVATLVPGDRPLHSLAAALHPLLEPEMSEVDRQREIQKLGRSLTEGDVALRDLVARALENQPGTDRLLLVADKWEELYTLCQDEPVRWRFMDQLLEATAVSPLTVVLTLRGDFFGHALSYRPLTDRLQGAVVNLGPMNREELERAVVAPAEKVGLRFESGLVPRILRDVGEEPGNLPLLEFVLTEFWEKKHEGQLLHEAYHTLGGVRGAIACRAEEFFSGLGLPEQELLRRVFMQMVNPGEGSEDTLRRATFREVGERAQPLLRKLADARLLVTGQDRVSGEETVEMAHEVLIRNWDRLRGWVDQDREFLLWCKRLRAAVDEWERNDNAPGSLLLGVPLAEAEQWLIQRPEDLLPIEREFIQESAAAREHERSAKERLRRWVTAGALLAAFVLLVLSGFAGLQWRRAQEERRRAEDQIRVALSQKELAETRGRIALSSQLAAQSKVRSESAPDLALLLGLESQRIHDNMEAKSAVLTGLLRNPTLAALIRGHKAYVGSVAFGSDGNAFAPGSSDKTVMLWDAHPESWKAHACRTAKRNLTKAEWRQFMGEEPYRKTCPELPEPKE